MPDTIRSTGGGRWAPPRHGGFRAAAAAVVTLPIRSGELHAQGGRGAAVPHDSSLFHAYVSAIGQLSGHELAALALTLGILCFGVVTAIMLVRARQRLAESELAARDRVLALTGDVDRVHALLLSEPQILVAWAAAEDHPEIIGDTSLLANGDASHHALAFRTWLDAEQAQAMEGAVANLRGRGQAFSMTLTTLAGRPIEAAGQVLGGRAVLRLKEIAGVRRELAELDRRFHRQREESEALRTLVEALPSPVWARDEAGKLVFANAAYARAVDARDASEVIGRGVELFDRAAREELFRAHEAANPYAARLPAIVGGNRRSFDVQMFPTRRGSAGVAVDATSAEAMRSEVKRMIEAHQRTLDQLTTGVAIFDSDQKLTFYNTAYRALWDLDASFLDQGPTDSAVLDRLRGAHRLPEEHNFRHWKAELHEAYRATEAKQHTWHLPDGRTLRVDTTPNPQGGVIYLFHDVTRRLDLERRYVALISVQSETLDNLAEAVAVFGSDGRLRLFNPAFARMWRLEANELAQRPHIEVVIAWAKLTSGEHEFWPALRSAVTAIDGREPVGGRLERRDGTVVDCATVPLPDGATLLTFLDVTDSVNVERALRERNEALEGADKIKIDFVRHVSYELRTPLNNITGFSDLLVDPVSGPLTDKQRDYLGYIQTSTNALLAIIDNILDLASIDAGAMRLELGPVDIRKTMDAAAEGVQDRLVQSDIHLNIRAAPDIGSFVADERRLRQALFNLLANAVAFSPAGETVTLAAQRLKDAVVFSVTDKGPGIPPDVQDRVFDWFETHSLGSRHRGTGLGLSLVRSFVELHGGSVTLDSMVGRGTTVTCVFPLGQAGEQAAA
ncbi:MAG: hypothetical protein QOF34_1295 [Sphingomonadales bacterium]|nr:hypothetical protein [Sphingomonadales bacterium]